LAVRVKECYAGGPRVLREKNEKVSISAGAKTSNLVSVKKGMPSKATAKGPVAV